MINPSINTLINESRIQEINQSIHLSKN